MRLGGDVPSFADRAHGLPAKKALRRIADEAQLLRAHVFGGWQAFLAGLPQVRTGIRHHLREAWLEDALLHCHQFVVQRRRKVMNVAKVRGEQGAVLVAP